MQRHVIEHGAGVILDRQPIAERASSGGGVARASTRIATRATCFTLSAPGLKANVKRSAWV
ncbi:MAG TPA: hypothetical protein VMH86_03720 [Rhizomicrobium sp.]|nr:hypothetical protein [Rhizomicrobium sp.]